MFVGVLKLIVYLTIIIATLENLTVLHIRTLDLTDSFVVTGS